MWADLVQQLVDEADLVVPMGASPELRLSALLEILEDKMDNLKADVIAECRRRVGLS